MTSIAWALRDVAAQGPVKSNTEGRSVICVDSDIGVMAPWGREASVRMFSLSLSLSLSLFLSGLLGPIFGTFLAIKDSKTACVCVWAAEAPDFL